MNGELNTMINNSMINSSMINNIILEETKALQELLQALEEQHSYVAKNDVFAMENVVSRIENCSREVAKCEMKRRKITGDKPMRLIVSELKDEELETNFRKIKKLIEEVRLQKDTNELLIRQGLGYSSRMLNIFSPDRSNKTYNVYGKMGKR